MKDDEELFEVSVRRARARVEELRATGYRAEADELSEQLEAFVDRHYSRREDLAPVS